MSGESHAIYLQAASVSIPLGLRRVETWGMGWSQLYIPIPFWIGVDFNTEAILLNKKKTAVSTVNTAVPYPCSSSISVSGIEISRGILTRRSRPITVRNTY